MNTNRPYASLQEFARLIAEALTDVTGEQWTRSTHFDADDCSWRAELLGPASKALFISNTWAPNGRLYIGASFSSELRPSIPYKAAVPSITVADTKSSVQIANDIKRRLLPDYEPLLLETLKRAAEVVAFERRRTNLAEEVSKVVNGRIQGEMVYSGGWDLQVSSDDSIRIQGHCNYITLDQLKKIQAVCPELFARKEEK